MFEIGVNLFEAIKLAAAVALACRFLKFLEIVTVPFLVSLTQKRGER